MKLKGHENVPRFHGCLIKNNKFIKNCKATTNNNAVKNRKFLTNESIFKSYKATNYCDMMENSKVEQEIGEEEDVIVDVEIEDYDLNPLKIYEKCSKSFFCHKNRKFDKFELEIISRDPTKYIASRNGFMNILRLNFEDLNNEQRLVWLFARYEAICKIIQESENNFSNIRMGQTRITKNHLLELLTQDHLRIFGTLRPSQIVESCLKIPPCTYFLKREELLYFGIARSPYETVSVEFRYLDGSCEAVATALILDSTPSLREDFGTRFIFYTKFGNSNSNENCDYSSQHTALFRSWIHEIPIRVVRGYNSSSRYTPVWGFRYDGLYRIIDAYSDNNRRGSRVWVFVFSICNEAFEPPVHILEEDCDCDILQIADVDDRSLLYSHICHHKKYQKSNRLRTSGDLKQVDVVYQGHKLFTIGIPHFLRRSKKKSDDRDVNNKPLLVNLDLIYNFIKKLCIETGIANEWLNGAVKAYEDRDKHTPPVWWAKGGFLPLLLIVQRIEPKKYLTTKNSRIGSKEKIYTKKIRHQKALAVNFEMAKTIARPFFPQSDTDSIWTYIELCEPISNSWDPYEDISGGTEVYPIPVENPVDSELPPMGFTYVRSNIFFSRLPHLNFDPVCAGCLPEGINQNQCREIVVNGFCKGVADKNGQIYCLGVNKHYLATIQSRAACSDNCPCPTTCPNRLPEGVQVPVKLIKTQLMGWALHTMVPIANGTFIMQYVGEIVCRSEMVAREHRYDKLGFFNYCMEAVEMEREHDDWQMPCLDSMIIGNIARFLNHSCEPNVEVITVWRGEDFPCIGVYAIKDIEAGDALTYCYGSAYKSIPCLCGTKSCKGYIGNL